MLVGLQSLGAARCVPRESYVFENQLTSIPVAGCGKQSSVFHSEPEAVPAIESFDSFRSQSEWTHIYHTVRHRYAVVHQAVR